MNTLSHTINPNIVKIKDMNFNKLRAVTRAQQSERQVLFSNELTSFPVSLTKDCHMCVGNKTKAIEIYNSNGKSTIPNIKPTAPAID